MYYQMHNKDHSLTYVLSIASMLYLVQTKQFSESNDLCIRRTNNALFCFDFWTDTCLNSSIFISSHYVIKILNVSTAFEKKCLRYS